ncbi:ABC-2 family transporter protein [Pseudomonas sp. N3-W]|uniref:ABC-2 family transporter protein n=1 Tax=Pseudomonas fungipugnans TaxID=3024217 RepID=A0ABT6QGZ1_9PSED|nr:MULTISPECIES: ABC-2 family transporter protein [unclassified Pseudomonas]MDI2590154.1 ABC-2 family transporter protein [Pseudomonas sp. 681]UWF46665.1 ABC-2 family transporter protein [Pseudomonas sp. N3-W]
MVALASLPGIAGRLIRTSVLVTVIYRAQLFVWLISGVAPLFMMLIWWELSRDQVIGGYAAIDFVAYFLGVYLVRQLTAVWVIFVLNDEIRQGTLSGRLLRPVAPFWFHVAEHVGQMVVRAPIVLAVFCVGASLFAIDLMAIVRQLPLFLVSLVLAWIIIFHIYYCVGLLAFWMANSLALDALVWSMYTVLGGMLIPVDLFPETTRHLVAMLPFSAALDFPVKVLIGKAAGLELMHGFAVQVFWVLVLVAVRRVLWRQGLKRFSGAGI